MSHTNKSKSPQPTSKGVEALMNSAFWGKKKLKKKGLAAKKQEVEKEAGQGSVEEVLEKDD